MKNRKKSLALLLSATLLLSPFQNGPGSAKPARGAGYGVSGPGVTTGNRKTEPIGEGSEVASVSLADYRSVAVTRSGDLYCWGWNMYGEVGNGSKNDQTTPVKVLENVSSVSLGKHHSAAVTKSDDLYCWGNNVRGQVGNGSIKDQTTPVKVLENVSSVSLGDSHSAAVTKSGDLYCWGQNYYGAVGNGSKGLGEYQATPVKVLENVSSVSLRRNHSAAVTKSGDLYCWGENNNWVDNGSNNDQATPVKVLENVSSVSLGHSHSAAVTKSGDLYCWGYNNTGQLGNGSNNDQATPIKVLENVSSVSLGWHHSAAVTKSGDLYCWGSNYDGQLGNGSKESKITTPVKVLENVSSVSLGSYHSAAVTKSGDLFCWGMNSSGEVGNGSKEDQTTPVKVLENLSSISLEGQYSAAVTKSGDLFCWGYNGYGQVGNGSTEHQTTPVKVLGNTHTTHIYGVDWISDATAHWKKCTVCDNRTEEAAHTEDAGTVTKEPTETETGLKTYKCSTCGYMIRTEEIQKLPPSHTHHYGSDWKTDPASHWHECDCGEKADQAEHTEDAGTVTKEPTETETGLKTYKCSVCGYVIRTEEIQKLPPSHTHHYGSDWKTNTASHWHECDCGEKADQAGHTEDSGTVTKEPTKTEIGKRTYKCSVCGYVTRTEDIDKLEDTKKPNKKPDTETSHDKLPPISKEERKENSIQMNKKTSFGWTGNSLTVTWNKLKNASGYDIYAAVCGNKFDEVTLSVKGGSKTHTKIKKVNGKNISKTTTYKVKIYAYRLVDGKKQYIGASNTMHVAGSKNRKITNAKKIKLAKSSYVIRKGNAKTIKASIVKDDKKKKLLSKKHGPKLMYTSSDAKIATVTKFGKIKAKKKGKCTIYVQALNGISRKVKVTVK